MTVDDVRTFVAAAEAGSISASAHALHLTQPAASRRIQRLEDALGTPLIDRKKRPFALTDVGRVALERCRRFLNAAAELQTLGDGSPGPTREIRVGVAHALTELALTEPVDQMRREFPAAALRLHTGWSRELLARVRNGALDSAIILMAEREGQPSGVGATSIAREHLVVVAPRTWPGRSSTIRQLREQPWILNPDGCAARAALQREFARARMPLRIAIETYNYELQLRLIARGRGLGLVPNRLLTRSPTRARLRTLRVRELSFPQVIWMVTGELVPGVEASVAGLRRALIDQLAE